MLERLKKSNELLELILKVQLLSVNVFLRTFIFCLVPKNFVNSFTGTEWVLGEEETVLSSLLLFVQWRALGNSLWNQRSKKVRNYAYFILFLCNIKEIILYSSRKGHLLRPLGSKFRKIKSQFYWNQYQIVQYKANNKRQMKNASCYSLTYLALI